MRTPIKLSIALLCLALTLVVVSRAAAQPLNQPYAQVETPISAQPLVTSTPASDGTVVHVVEYGQALITIAQAYGISVNDLKAMNALTDDSLYAGQKLIIHLGATATVTITPTRTPVPTRTPTATRPPSTTTPLPTITPTPTQMPNPLQAWLNKNTFSSRQTLGIGIAVVCLLGLVVVGLTGFRKS